MVRIWRAFPATALPAAALLLLADAQTALADSAWPNMDSQFERGPGYYFSLPKIIIVWIIFLCWVKTTDMVNQDCQRLRLNYFLWNPVVFFTFVVAFLLFWEVPSFFLGLFLLLLGYLGPLTAYILQRNKTLPPERRILTPDHFRHLMVERAKTVGVKIDPTKKAHRREGPPVEFKAQGGKTDQVDAANLLLARQSPGFPLARELIADAMEHRAEGILLDFTEQGVPVRYQIDGVWHPYQPRERAAADVMLAVLKTLAALNVNERKAKQEGKFAAEFKGAKRACRITSRGVPTGEQVVLQLIEPSVKRWTIEELGMRNKVEEQLKSLTQQTKGIILFSALPAGGLTTTLDTVVYAMDRYLRDVVSVEDAVNRQRDIENLQVTTYNSAAGETPMTVLPKLARAYPNVYIIRDLPGPDAIKFLCSETEEDRLVVTGLRAKDSAEALLRVLLTKAPAPEFAKAVIGVVNQRMIRKLCEKCKEAFAPTPEMLKQMGLPAGRVQALYRPPEPQPGQQPPPPCPDCLGLGYRGRTAIFELLVVDAGVREALVKTPKLELVRAAARKAGMRSLQEEGVVMVVKGVTSLPELMRVSKPPTTDGK